jgi:nitrate/nitrite-specific signal transduction histidine kinase
VGDIMRKRSFYFSICIALAVLFSSFQANAANLNIGEVINKAGMQRMLSQRIMKAYILKGIGDAPQLANAQLLEGIALFESNLKYINRFTSSLKTDIGFNALVNQWGDFNVIVKNSPSKKNAKILLSMSDTLLKNAHTLTVNLQELSGSKNSELINVAGRQRMLSQQISKLYMAYCWKIKGEEALDEMMVVLSEYEVALNFLRQSDKNTKQINNNLRRVSGQLRFAQKSFDKLDQGRYLIHVVNSTTDTMLKQMDAITHLYVENMPNYSGVANR